MNRVVSAFTNKLSAFKCLIIGILVQFLSTLTKTEKVKVAQMEACPLDMSSDHQH